MKHESESIKVYNSKERIEVYDNNMKIMHPNRNRMIQIVLEFIPYKTDKSFTAIDLGIGNGFFSYELLKKYPNCTIIGIDGAEAMIMEAKTRLKNYLNQIEFKIIDFKELEHNYQDLQEIDIIISSYALHHLNKSEKEKLLTILFKCLKKDGWFFNADILIAESPDIEFRFQELRIEGILKRANNDKRFIDFQTTREFLDNLEHDEKDQPFPLTSDLEIFKKTGFKNVDILWKEYRESVICAQKK